MSKKIMILYSDGSVESKKEKDITGTDIKLADFFLISISPENESYTIIKPSKYLKFTKAIVEYQLCMFHSEDDYDDVNFVTLNPVRCEVTSICDLIGLLNSIDRLGITNYMLNPDCIADWGCSIGVDYFQIKLFDDDRIIYDSYYEIKGVNSPIFDAYQVVKHFKDIYTNTIVSSYYVKNKKLYLYTEDNKVYWKLNRDFDDYALIGIMLPTSNTITFLTSSQYDKLELYHYMELYMNIYYDKNTIIADVSEMIVNGKSRKERESIMSDLHDVYFDDSQLFSTTSKASDKLVEIISNANYVLNILYITYSELFGPNKTDDRYDFDIILTFTMKTKSSSKGKMKELSLNRYSLITISSILDNLT